MPSPADNVILTFPPRTVSQGNRCCSPNGSRPHNVQVSIRPVLDELDTMQSSELSGHLA
jgi:hypothetical protein